ncbi:MAG TPA: EAL domain-containing protein [Stellaceae bacterium]|nr:EAL domain-containing protein [Stellaceae bacterium]
MPPGGQPPERPPRRGIATPFLGTEDTLFSYVDQLAEARAGQRAMIVHLSRLDRSHRNDKHLQIVVNMLQQVMEQYPGRLFALGKGDVVAICKGITRRAFDETTELFRYLFNDDPLAAESVQRADFCALFDLEIDYPQFQSALEEIGETAQRQSRAAARATPQLETSAIRSPRIDEVVRALARIDMTSLVRRQTVWQMLPAQRPDPISDEIFISLDRVRKAVNATTELTKDRQLLHDLMLWLDKHLLATVTRYHASVMRPLSVDIHLATLLSPVFDDFDENPTIETRDRIIFELQLAELAGDLPGYLSASKRLKERGYRRCLDGVSHQALLYINLRRLDVDYVKVVWDDALLQVDDHEMRELRQAIADCGAERIILTRCGRRQAIDVGQAMGIKLFQGWQVDQANRS